MGMTASTKAYRLGVYKADKEEEMQKAKLAFMYDQLAAQQDMNYQNQENAMERASWNNRGGGGGGAITMPELGASDNSQPESVQIPEPIQGNNEDEEIKNYKLGGIVPPGKIQGEGTETSDSIEGELQVSDAIIPANIVKQYGVPFFQKLIQMAPPQLGQRDTVTANVSKGEFRLPAYVVEFLGEDFINKLIGNQDDTDSNNYASGTGNVKDYSVSQNQDDDNERTKKILDELNNIPVKYNQQAPIVDTKPVQPELIDQKNVRLYGPILGNVANAAVIGKGLGEAFIRGGAKDANFILNSGILGETGKQWAASNPVIDPGDEPSEQVNKPAISAEEYNANIRNKAGAPAQDAVPKLGQLNSEQLSNLMSLEGNDKARIPFTADQLAKEQYVRSGQAQTDAANKKSIDAYKLGRANDLKKEQAEKYASTYHAPKLEVPRGTYDNAAALQAVTNAYQMINNANIENEQRRVASVLGYNENRNNNFVADLARQKQLEGRGSIQDRQSIPNKFMPVFNEKEDQTGNKTKEYAGTFNETTGNYQQQQPRPLDENDYKWADFTISNPDYFKDNPKQIEIAKQIMLKKKYNDWLKSNKPK